MSEMQSKTIFTLLLHSSHSAVAMPACCIQDRYETLRMTTLPLESHARISYA